MKLIKRIGALLVTVAMLCSLLVFAPASTVSALEGAGIPGDADNLYWGCDVSFYNVGDNSYANGYTSDDSGADYSLVDFAKMKADGCDFVILRIGSEDSSGYYVDPHFYTYYDMAREADMDIGLYYYSYALTYAEAAAEAEFIIDAVEGMYFEYPLYIDIEESDQLALGETALSNVCYGWCETMEDAGYFPGIYGNYTLYDGISTAVKNTYDTWIAWVSSADSMSSYTPTAYNLSDECGMWQYSFYGYEYDGIGLDMLDVNVAYKDYPAIMAQYGYNNVDGSGATKTNLSKNAAYYPDDNTRTDDYVDDQAKLTDGSKGSLYGGETARYSGWFSTALEIIVDLGEALDSNTYNVYAASNSSWGIGAPTGFMVSVSDSLDGTYTQVASTSTVTTTGSETTYGWSTHLMSVTIDTPANARYVKFTVLPDDTANGGHLWLDEVEAIYDSSLVDEGSGDSGDDDDDTTETTIITSVAFTADEDAPVAGEALYTPTLYSVNGSTALTDLIASQFTAWYYGASFSYSGGDYTSYSGTTFESGYAYDLYVRVTAGDTATISEDCTFTLITPNKQISGYLYEYSASDNKISFDMFFDLTGSGDSGSGDEGDDDSGNTTIPVEGTEVWISGFNTSITAGAAQIFTPDFGTVSNSTANVTWTANCIAKYDPDYDAYVVTQMILPSDSGCTVDYTLADDEIFIAVHEWEETVEGSTQNRENLMSVQVGMLLEFNDIAIDSQTLGSDPYIKFYTQPDPIVSLGAKANEELCGIRFGATYNKVFSYGEVKDMGFLLISEYRLGDNTLDLNYLSNSEIAEYVVRVKACTIAEYVDGQDFENYTTFTFFASVVRLDRKGNEDDNIVAVPYIVYADGTTFLGEQMVNSYNGVMNGDSSFAE